MEAGVTVGRWAAVRLAAALAGAAALLTVAPLPADAAPGKIFQFNGAYGCTSDSGGEGCATGRQLGGAASVAISPDGRNAYVASEEADSVTTFLRDKRGGRVGRVVQPGGLNGCITPTGLDRCLTGRALNRPFAIAVSPDGANVYVASLNAVAVFSRERPRGALTQLPGGAGCVALGVQPGCGPARGIAAATDIAISRDGLFAYVAGPDSDAVAIFARNPISGALDQLPGPAGCISASGAENCATARGLNEAHSLALNPSGTRLFVTGQAADAVAVLVREPATGHLTQFSGEPGCVSTTGAHACGTARGIRAPSGIAVAPDGGFVYVAGTGSDAIAAFRVGADGRLEQLAGRRGCISRGGQEGCRPALELEQAFGVAISPDSRNVYVTSLEAVTAFRRGSSGRLRRLACVSDDPIRGCRDGRALAEAAGIAIDSRGRNVYATGYASDALTVFTRNPHRGRVRLKLRRVPNGCVRDKFRARVKVSSRLPLRKVKVYLDGHRVGSKRDDSFGVRVRPGPLRDGRHALMARATDVTGTRDAGRASFRIC